MQITREQQNYIQRVRQELQSNRNVSSRWSGFNGGSETNKNAVPAVVPQFVNVPLSMTLEKTNAPSLDTHPYGKPRVIIDPALDWNARYPISLMFLHQNDHTRNNLGNRLTEWMTGSDIIHVELRFDRHNLTCSVDQDANVSFWAGKDYACDERIRWRWECVQLYVSAASYYQMYQFCWSQNEEPFDSCGLMNFFGIQLWHHLGETFCNYSVRQLSLKKQLKKYRGWICSRLVAVALREGGIIKETVDVFALTPGDLLAHFTTQMPAHLITFYNCRHVKTVSKNVLK